MSESKEPIDSPTDLLPEESIEQGRGRQLFACFLSTLFPGSGHLLLGQRHKAAVLLALLCILILGFWPLRLLRFYWGFVVLYASLIALYLYAVCSICVARPPSTQRLSKWWLLAVVPVTLGTVSLIGMAGTRLSGFRSFVVPTTSMEDTIRKGDGIVVDTRRYANTAVPRQEIAVFSRNGIYLVKRVIATGGDSVAGKDGDIFVNGRRLTEPYVEHRGRPEAWMQDFGPINIPPDEYFVLGDNRDVNLDSRSTDFGPVPAQAVLGVPLYVFRSDRPGKAIR